jgi:hypothetical protein
MQGPRRDVTFCATGNVFPILERTIVPSSGRVKQVILLGAFDPEDEGTAVL